MLLQYKPEDTVRINGKDFKLDTSFDVVLRTIDLLNDDSLPKEIRLDSSFLLLFEDENIADEIEYYNNQEKAEVVNHILENYLEHDEEASREYDILGNVIEKSDSSSEVKLMDFNQDAELIYSAFMQAYGIDLIEEQGRLSWYKFKALLNGLPANTEFMKVVQIRSWKPDSEKKKYNDRMRELQNKYRLK